MKRILKFLQDILHSIKWRLGLYGDLDQQLDDLMYETLAQCKGNKDIEEKVAFILNEHKKKPFIKEEIYVD